MKRSFSAVLYLAVFVGSGCSEQTTHEFQRKGTKEQRAIKDQLEGKAPPVLHAFDWTNTNDKELHLPDLKGKVVVLHFWGVWSDESKAATAKLKKLHEKHHKAGLVIVGIHTTRQGGKMAGYVEKEGIVWPVAIDKLGETVTAFAADDFPANYLIDRKGILRVADLVEDNLDHAVEILLKEK